VKFTYQTKLKNNVKLNNLGGGNLFMPILLFPPPKFQNSKIGIGKNWHKLAKIVKIARLALAKIGINWQKLAKIENLAKTYKSHKLCTGDIFFENKIIFRPKCET
jgi:hypothetical protein